MASLYYNAPCWFFGYDTKRLYGINVADPGAVPGGSTIICFEPSFQVSFFTDRGGSALIGGLK